MAESYLTVDEVAKRFGVNIATVYRLIHQGVLPAIKFGGLWRFNETTLTTWESNQLRKGAAGADVQKPGQAPNAS